MAEPVALFNTHALEIEPVDPEDRVAMVKAEIAAMTKIIEAEGYTYLSVHGNPTLHPCVRARQAAIDLLIRLQRNSTVMPPSGDPDQGFLFD